MPIHRRIPKRGFKNNDRIEYKVFNLGQIEALAEKYGISEFSPENLYMNSLISRTDKVKILGNGAIASKFGFKVHAVSGKAKEAIEAAGGSVEIVK
jgi:large subunit ribosomal protein L15